MYTHVCIIYIYIHIHRERERDVLQTCDCAHFFYGNILQAVSGAGMGMNVTAHFGNPSFSPLFSLAHCAAGSGLQVGNRT